MSQITPLNAGARAFLTWSHFQSQSLSDAGDLARGCLSKAAQWIPTISLSKRDIAPAAKMERDQFNALICQVCLDASAEALDEDVFAELVKKVYQALTSEEALVNSVNFLISVGVEPAVIESGFLKEGIELPAGAYTDWGILNAAGHRSWMGSVPSNLQAISKIGSRWILHNWSSILGTWAFVQMVSRLPAAVAAPSDCPIPEGSYQETCKVKSAKSYHSTDPHLKDVDFCEYSIECKPLNWKEPPHTNTKFLAKEDASCLKLMENCDGHLVLREGNDRLCTDPVRAKEHSKSKTEL
jgi:hypothetical protein